MTAINASGTVANGADLGAVQSKTRTLLGRAKPPEPGERVSAGYDTGVP